MKSLIMAFILLINLACEITKEEIIDNLQCMNESYSIPDVKLYASVENGKSCEHFNSRKHKSFPLCAGTAPETLQCSDTFSNNEIGNIFSGENIFIDDFKIYSVRSRSLYIEDKQNLSLIESIDLKFSATKVYKSESFIAVASNMELSIYDFNLEEIFYKNFNASVEFKFKKESIYISFSKIIENLEDEAICESINYIDDSTGSNLFQTEIYNGETNSITEKSLYFGFFTQRVDEKSNYLLSRHNYDASILIKNDSSKKMKKINGQIPSVSYLKEYGDSLHVFTNTWQNGTSYLVLDNNLNEEFKLENIAFGETLGAVNFEKDFSYIMTYRQVDPLFVFDLKDNAKPQLVGELKFPGIPKYLTQIEPGRLMSVNTSLDGNLDLSYFDVSVPSDPIRLSNTNTGIYHGWKPFQAKDILVHNSHIIIKGEYKLWVYTLRDDQFIVNTTIDILNTPQIYLSDNSLFVRDGREWERVDLDD